MSLRFDRKGSLRLRSSFSANSSSSKVNSRDSSSSLMSWSFRQNKFACDYLNLMEPGTMAPGVNHQKNHLSNNGPFHTKSHHHSHSHGGSGGGSNGSSGRSDILLLNDKDLCQCDCSHVGGGERNNSGKNRKLTPSVSFRDGVELMTSSSNGGGTGRHNGMIVRRNSTLSSYTSTSSCMSSRSSTASDASSIYCESIFGGGSTLSGYGFDYEHDDDDSKGLDTRPADPFRFSQATLEDTQEDELNAILGELSALQMSLDREIKNGPSLLEVPGTAESIASSKSGGGGGGSASSVGTHSESGVRTDSPDNDSGFSDNASLLSSGSSLSATGSSSGSSTTSCPLNKSNHPSSNNVIHANEDEKAEKIRVALAKMRAASVTRLYVKAFSLDGSSKALMVDESMTCGRVLALLADKNHVALSGKWALVEHIPHLHMERIYEDHENMVENLLMWTRDSKNKIYFVEKEEKYDMFTNPQRYFLESRLSGDCLDEHTKNSLIEEFFNHGGVGVPEVESILYLKAEGKKAWKKFPFVLRASGIYYYPKGKSHANSSKDLVCLAPIDHNQQAYQSFGWRKKFKAPTEYGFVIKPARLQVKSHRHMKYLCAEDADTLRLWMVGLRIAKYGRQLWENYRILMEDLAHEDLDRFGRSVSLACMPQQNSNHPVLMVPPELSHLKSQQQQHLQKIAEQQTSSNGSLPPPPPPLPKEEGFESDCPVGGTIKRKPSAGLTAKIPLTLNTRSIVGDYISMNSSPGEAQHTLTLQRKRSLSGNSSASSSNSSVTSAIYAPGHNTNNNVPINLSRLPPTPPPNKPHTGSLKRTQSTPKPASVAEETAIDYDSLPPPPPELLMSEDSSSPSPRPPPSPKPMLPPTHKPSSSSAAENNSIYSSASLQSTTPLLPPAPPASALKKGVSFATELTERLKSRSESTAKNKPVEGSTPLPPPPPPAPSASSAVSSTSTLQTRKSVSFGGVVESPSSLPVNKLEEPPQEFMSDLQRVMQKKWQVAQKCNADKTTTPAEILGFKFGPEGGSQDGADGSGAMDGSSGSPAPPPASSHVQQWVSQHYGGTLSDGGSSGANNPSPPLRSNSIISNNNSTLLHQTPSSPKPPPPVRSTPSIYSTTSSSSSLPQVPSQYPSNQMNNGFPPPPPPQPPLYSASAAVPSVQSNNANNSGIVIYENFQGRKSQQANHHIMNQFQYDPVHLRNKKPPPPVPKRAESTHLSAHIVFN